MTAIEIDKDRESDDACVTHDKSNESDNNYEKYGDSNGESYEASRAKNSSEYTPYEGHAVEVVYDRYESDYEEEQTGQEPKPTTRKESCCKKGWLSNSENIDCYS